MKFQIGGSISLFRSILRPSIFVGALIGGLLAGIQKDQMSGQTSRILPVALASNTIQKPIVVENLEFTAKSNIPGMIVKGTATETGPQSPIKGTMDFQIDAGGNTVKKSKKTDSSEFLGVPLKLEFTIPIESLTTQMELRDQHMRERIFQKEDKTFPAIHYISKQLNCEGAPSIPYECQTEGFLSIQGKAKPVGFRFRVEKKGDFLGFAGGTTLKLSDFEIPLPQHLGVRVKDEVEISAKGQVQINR